MLFDRNNSSLVLNCLWCFFYGLYNSKYIKTKIIWKDELLSEMRHYREPDY